MFASVDFISLDFYGLMNVTRTLSIVQNIQLFALKYTKSCIVECRPNLKYHFLNRETMPLSTGEIFSCFDKEQFLVMKIVFPKETILDLQSCL